MIFQFVCSSSNHDRKQPRDSHPYLSMFDAEVEGWRFIPGDSSNGTGGRWVCPDCIVKAVRQSPEKSPELALR